MSAVFPSKSVIKPELGLAASKILTIFAFLRDVAR